MTASSVGLKEGSLTSRWNFSKTGWNISTGGATVENGGLGGHRPSWMASYRRPWTETYSLDFAPSDGDFPGVETIVL